MTVVFGTEVAVTLIPVHCCECSCLFGIDDGLNRRRHEDGQLFYCPNGHPQRYSESEVKKLRRHLKFAQDDANRQRSMASTERLSKIAYKGQLTRARKMIGSGDCPACGKHLNNLATHMTTKHPEFADAEVND